MKNVCPAGLLLIAFYVLLVPSGFYTLSLHDALPILIAYTTIRCAAVPLKLRRTSCPATVVALDTGKPSVLIAATTAERMLTEPETLPVAMLCGLITIEKVPVAASVTASM